MKSSPGSAFEVIEAQIVLVALKVLLDLKALPAQSQQADALRRPVQPRRVDMVAQVPQFDKAKQVLEGVSAF